MREVPMYRINLTREDRVLDGPVSEDECPYASYPEYSRAAGVPCS